MQIEKKVNGEEFLFIIVSMDFLWFFTNFRYDVIYRCPVRRLSKQTVAWETEAELR